MVYIIKIYDILFIKKMTKGEIKMRKSAIITEAINVAEKTVKEDIKNNNMNDLFIKNQLSDFVSNYHNEILEVYSDKCIILEQRNFNDIGEVKYHAAMQIAKELVDSYIKTINEISA